MTTQKDRELEEQMKRQVKSLFESIADTSKDSLSDGQQRRIKVLDDVYNKQRDVPYFERKLKIPKNHCIIQLDPWPKDSISFMYPGYMADVPSIEARLVEYCTNPNGYCGEKFYVITPFRRIILPETWKEFILAVDKKSKTILRNTPLYLYIPSLAHAQSGYDGSLDDSVVDGPPMFSPGEYRSIQEISNPQLR